MLAFSLIVISAGTAMMSSLTEMQSNKNLALSMIAVEFIALAPLSSATAKDSSWTVKAFSFSL